MAIALCAAGCERGDRVGLIVPTEQLSVPIDDATLVAQLRDKLSASDAAEGKAVSVRASDGMVTLSGRVSSAAARQIAAAIAHDVHGVQEVDNRIVVAQLSNRESTIR